jgi:hypothetical protein
MQIYHTEALPSAACSFLEETVDAEAAGLEVTLGS